MKNLEQYARAPSIEVRTGTGATTRIGKMSAACRMNNGPNICLRKIIIIYMAEKPGVYQILCMTSGTPIPEPEKEGLQRAAIILTTSSRNIEKIRQGNNNIDEREMLLSMHGLHAPSMPDFLQAQHPCEDGLRGLQGLERIKAGGVEATRRTGMGCVVERCRHGV